MAVKKYTLNSRGYYATRVWDGTYNADGSKHRTYISSKKSSRDLELKVAAFKRKVEEGTVYSDTKILFGTYARYWLKPISRSARPTPWPCTGISWTIISPLYVYLLSGI